MIFGREHAREFVPNFVELYQTSIKPLLKEKNYWKAHVLLDTSIQYIEQFSTAIILESEGNINLLAHTIALHRETMAGGTPREHTLRSLDTFIGQYEMRQKALEFTD